MKTSPRNCTFILNTPLGLYDRPERLWLKDNTLCLTATCWWISERKRALLPIGIFKSEIQVRFSLVKCGNCVFNGTTAPFSVKCLMAFTLPSSRLPSGKHMKKSLIPWHVFREAVAIQDPWALDSWLRRWGFTDEGVVLVSNQISLDAPAPLTQVQPRLPSRLKEL